MYCGDTDGPALCRLCKEVISQQNLPNYLRSDNDPLFQYQRWKANLRILELQEIKSIPHVPLSHPFVERLIGSVRRELLDQVFFCNGEDLKRKLASYQAYYNEHRTHTAHAGVPPESSEGNVLINRAHHKWQSHCRGSCYLPVAA